MATHTETFDISKVARHFFDMLMLQSKPRLSTFQKWWHVICWCFNPYWDFRYFKSGQPHYWYIDASTETESFNIFGSVDTLSCHVDACHETRTFWTYWCKSVDTLSWYIDASTKTESLNMFRIVDTLSWYVDASTETETF